MKLLQKIHSLRLKENEKTRKNILKHVKSILKSVLPKQKIYIFGSITKPFQFSKNSDVDLALVDEPKKRSIYALQAELEELIKYPVDLCILNETRFKDKIIKEGKLWMS